MLRQMESATKYPLEKVFRLAIVFLSFLITAQAAKMIFFSGTAPAVIWAPAGIALAAILTWGYGMWPAITLAAITNNLVNGGHIPAALMVAFAATAEPLAAAYFLKKINFNKSLAKSRDMFWLIFTALTFGSIAPTLKILIAHLNHLPQKATLSGLWIGEAFSIIILVPILLRWADKNTSKTLPRKEIFETLATFALLYVLSFWLYWMRPPPAVATGVLFASFIPFFIFSIRMGMSHTAAALFFTAAIGFTGLAFGAEAIPPGLIGQKMLSTELLISIYAGFFLILAAVSEERKLAINSKEEYILKLEKAFKQIANADQAKTEFIAVLAHELRNPLSPIVSNIELLRRLGLAAPEAHELLSIIEKSADNMSRLLDDLLDISSITAHKFKLQLADLKIAEVVKNSLNNVAHLAGAKNIRLDVVAPPYSAYIRADSLRLEQIFTNILNNSIKFTDPGGLIAFSAICSGDILKISIKDSGLGISRSAIKTIFNPFAQTGQRTLGQKGLGIGLALAKNLVELHGGVITAKSEGYGKGAEFIITFGGISLKANEPQALPASDGNKEDEKNHYNILVVDDNLPAADSMSKLLKFVGHNVSLAYDGESALEKMKENMPHVVLLDIGLPGINGYEVAKKARKELNSDSTLVALTGYGQSDDKVKAKEAGFDYHLVKPVGITDIEKILIGLPPPPLRPIR